MDNNIEKRDEKLFLIFNVSKELYGIDVSGVNNIIMMPAITFIPKTPACYEGVINQRGEVIPVMSLSKRMNIGEDVRTKDTRVIILNLSDGKRVGVIVDAVKEVITLPTDEIEKPSAFVNRDEQLISGFGRRDSNLISILEINELTKLNYAS